MRVPKSDTPTGVAEAAAILGTDRRTVVRMISRGTLPAHKMPGKTGAWIISRADVEALLTTERAAS